MNIKEPYQQAQRAETPPQAIGIYEKIIQRDPQNSEAYNNIGELYVNMGQPTGGLIVNKKLIKENVLEITEEDFDKVDVRIGTIVAVDVNKKARHPAYKLTVDLGEEIGTKTSSAQITDLYNPEQLIGRQAVFCVNLKPMHIGSVKSEVRILGSESTGGVVLLQPSMQVKNGDRIF